MKTPIKNFFKLYYVDSAVFLATFKKFNNLDIKMNVGA